MWPPVLPLLQALLLARASAGTSESDPRRSLQQQDHNRFSRGAPPSCQYEGRLFPEGAEVSTRDACLRCRCTLGALSCQRRSCGPPPEPPPPHCRLVHPSDACCPHTECSDGGVGARRAGLAVGDVHPARGAGAHVSPVCAEGGAAYAAGSAMSSGTACEQCFCLGGGRRCVRPRCLPPPPGCTARPAPGACCPQRYHCDHRAEEQQDTYHLHDCNVDGTWVTEGEGVAPPRGKGNCTQCYCLRGEVRCQPLACAPPLMGCEPVLEPGECCPHRYRCTHQKRPGVSGYRAHHTFDNGVISTRNLDRTFRNVRTNETLTTGAVAGGAGTEAGPPAGGHSTTTTTKVKRKTSGPPPSAGNLTAAAPTTTAAAGTTTPARDGGGTAAEGGATEQPEGSVKIIINGTINCTAELSSSTYSANFTEADGLSERVHMEELQPRVPSDPPTPDTHTYNPNDIITDRNYSEDFGEDESYAINVTSSLISSLRTNQTQPAAAPPTTPAQNDSRQAGGGYEYTYEKPTLPPSLPNLKIIPFVAADAVLDDEAPSKETLEYPAAAGGDKYPVYYPGAGPKDVPFTEGGEELYHHTQFPIFLTKKEEPAQYPPAGHRLPHTDQYPGGGELVTSLHGFTAPSTAPTATTDRGTPSPAAGLFSPPMETEGGFIPREPGLLDDYYAPYPATPAGSLLPHLTTSMQLDTGRGCVVGGAGRVPDGGTVGVACSVCVCAWGELHCSPRACPAAPPGCSRQHAAADACCGDLVCGPVNETSSQQQQRPLPTDGALASLNTTGEPVTGGTYTVTGSRVTTSTSTESSASSPSAAGARPKTSSEQPVVPHGLTSGITVSDVKRQTTSAGTEPPHRQTTAEERADTYGNSSQEYEDEDDDEGFSFGSVLKLLLSDGYETTTSAPVKYSPWPATRVPAPGAGAAHVPTTEKQSPKSTNAATSTPTPTTTHAPVSTSRSPYTPGKKQPQNTINRIDHLVLGEATAIKLTTPRPVTVPFKPFVTRKPTPGKPSTTQKRPPPSPSPTRPLEVTHKSDFSQYTPGSPAQVAPSAHNSPAGLGPGLLKLAGCNIYGQMYRVGRIIAELSTPCQECRCTELGVQCSQLHC